MDYLTISHLKKSFDELGIIKNISLAVEEGEAVSIIGPSSSGRFTLLRRTAILEQMDSEEIIYLGEKAAWTGEDGSAIYAKKEKMRGIQSCHSLVFQNFNLLPHYSVMENIIDAPIRVQKREKEGAYWGAKELLRKTGLGDREHAYPYQPSDDQCQRTAIIRALALNPRMLFSDGPTSAFDPELTREVPKVIRSLADIHITMVIVIHEVAFARDTSDRVIFVTDGVIMGEDRPEEAFASANEYTKSSLDRYGDMLQTLYRDPCRFKDFM